MFSFGKIYLRCSYLAGCYKNVLHGRTNSLIYFRSQSREHTRKSAEEKLGIEKPKRPLNPFFKFMDQMRPALNAKIPGISAKEAVVWGSTHWQQLDNEIKSQMKNEYEKELEKYRKQKTLYDASLTEEQKGEIKSMNEQMKASQEKRKIKSEMKEMGKPRKPMSSYLLYTQSRKDVLDSQQIKKYQEIVKEDWLRLSESERSVFDKQAQNLMKKYKKDIEAWELKMISMGHLHLVRKKPPKQKKDKNT